MGTLTKTATNTLHMIGRNRGNTGMGRLPHGKIKRLNGGFRASSVGRVLHLVGRFAQTILRPMLKPRPKISPSVSDLEALISSIDDSNARLTLLLNSRNINIGSSCSLMSSHTGLNEYNPPQPRYAAHTPRTISATPLISAGCLLDHCHWFLGFLGTTLTPG